MECPICKSIKTRKFGIHKNKTKIRQKYRCNTCGHIWIDYSKNSRKKRILLLGDAHCGHLAGLTPNTFNIKEKPYNDFRTESWRWFSNAIELFKPFDFAIFNGDMIDGKQRKGGGLETLYPDRFDQIRMATEIANRIEATKNIVVRGTKYHVGDSENFEDDFADRINANIYDRFIGEIGGKIFDIRHKIGRSSVPHGRFTPLSKQVLWSRLRQEKTGIRADVIVRSHVHYHICLEENGIMAMTLPALQGNSAYGALECDGEVDFGMVVLDLEIDGRIVKHTLLPNLKSLEIEVVKF